jgi:hypothetical protein
LRKVGKLLPGKIEERKVNDSLVRSMSSKFLTLVKECNVRGMLKWTKDLTSTPPKPSFGFFFTTQYLDKRKE